MKKLKRKLDTKERLKKVKRIAENTALFLNLFGQDSRANQDLPINPFVSIHTNMKMDKDGDYEFTFNMTDKDSNETIVVYARIDSKGEIAWTTANDNPVPHWHDIAQWVVDSVLIDYETRSNKVREKAEEFLGTMSEQGYDYRRVGESGVFYLRDNPELKEKVDAMKTKQDAIKGCDLRIKL